jgi:hypothetical protein
MCFLVLPGVYHCGHPTFPNHGFPNQFIRSCTDRRNGVPCDLLPNEEPIPWLCPNCHWIFVQEHFTLLWEQATTTAQDVLEAAEMFPAEPAYLRSQRAVSDIRAHFQHQQHHISKSAVAFHVLRDKTLRAFMGESFRTYLTTAHEANRPWSLAIIRDPFTRTRSDFLEGYHPPSSPDSSNDSFVRSAPQMETDPATGLVIVRPHQELRPRRRGLRPASARSDDLDSPFAPTTERLARSPSQSSFGDLTYAVLYPSGSESLEDDPDDVQCEHCSAHGTFFGVTPLRPICDRCLALLGFPQELAPPDQLQNLPSDSQLRRSPSALALSEHPNPTREASGNTTTTRPQPFVNDVIDGTAPRIQHIPDADSDGPSRRRRRLNSLPQQPPVVDDFSDYNPDDEYLEESDSDLFNDVEMVSDDDGGYDSSG